MCASEVPGFNKLLAEFEKRNCVVLGCSTDTVHAHKGWKLLSKVGPTRAGAVGLGVEYKLCRIFTTREVEER